MILPNTATQLYNNNNKGILSEYYSMPITDDITDDTTSTDGTYSKPSTSKYIPLCVVFYI